jgi:hypothetical protein
MTDTARAQLGAWANTVGARPPEDRLAADLIWGAKAIADEIGVGTRKAFYLLETGAIPARKINGLWVSSRSQLRARLLGEAA